MKVRYYECDYSDKDLESMTLEQLKLLKHDLTMNIKEIGTKRTEYKNNNNQKFNSNTFWKHMNGFAKAIQANQRNISYIQQFIIQKQEEQQENEKEWLYVFYKNIRETDEKLFELISKKTDYERNYHPEGLK